MPAEQDMADVVYDSAGMLGAMVRRDTQFAQAGVDLGDPVEMLWVICGWLADAVRALPPEGVEAALEGFRALGRPDGGWADYDAGDL